MHATAETEEKGDDWISGEEWSRSVSRFTVQERRDLLVLYRAKYWTTLAVKTGFLSGASMLLGLVVMMVTHIDAPISITMPGRTIRCLIGIFFLGLGVVLDRYAWKLHREPVQKVVDTALSRTPAATEAAQRSES
jgi:hypothetical protein